MTSQQTVPTCIYTLCLKKLEQKQYGSQRRVSDCIKGVQFQELYACTISYANPCRTTLQTSVPSILSYIPFHSVPFYFDSLIEINYRFLCHAIENTANQNAGKLLYIRQYSTEPSHQSVQFSCVTPSLPIGSLYFLWHGIKQLCNPLSWNNRGISHLSLVFS